MSDRSNPVIESSLIELRGDVGWMEIHLKGLLQSIRQGQGVLPWVSTVRNRMEVLKEDLERMESHLREYERSKETTRLNP
jgi:hypothetical protein